VETEHYTALDTDGIEHWLAETLRRFAGIAAIGAIIPVCHGAALTVVRGDRLACPPLDYEEPMPATLRRDYDALRDPFADSGSPALPGGLNLGAQLFRLEALFPGLLDGDEIIMPWAQYWSWLLCGVAATEVSSLGCHSDLWRPAAGAPSRLAEARGWARHFAPLARAGDRLGTLTEAWAARTGLDTDVAIHCGLHDSNAALIAARAFAELAEVEATILSTGTWFVAMRSPARGHAVDARGLDEARDCLINIDVDGRPVPSARFMGGREIEILTDAGRIDGAADQAAIVAAIPAVLAAGAMVLPSFAPGFGPFPDGPGRWIAEPSDETARRAAVALYVALVADVSLELIGSSGPILVEGRFADAQAFVRALAALRPEAGVHAVSAGADVSFGSLRLLMPGLAPASTLARVVPLAHDLTAYRARWRHEAERVGRAD
jgi:sugar (pentulose or hexulose) kinase